MADPAEEQLLQLQADVSALQASLAQQALTSTSAQADALDLRNQLTQQAASTAAAEATVQALQATVTAAATAAAGTQAATAPVFYVAPASATGNTFLDLASSHGAKHFKVASEPLNSLPFDFKDDSDLQLFLDLVLIKSQHWGWTSLFCIPVLDPVTSVSKTWNLLDHYGVVPLASVRDHAMTYYSTPSKQAQDSVMMYHCLLGSLSVGFLKIITAELLSYHLPALVAIDGPFPSGPLLLKVIISRAHVDSRATVSFLRNSLSVLDDKMVELDSNVVEFNTYVRAQVQALYHRHQKTSDLMVNLLKGYKKATDVEFQDLIRRLENDYEEGRDVTVESLMVATDMKYRTRVLNKRWSAPTKEQEQILALTAQVEHLKDSKVPRTTKPPKIPLLKQPRPKTPNKWAWKDVLPKQGEPTTKLFEGTQYHVNCPFHKNQWVAHPVEECHQNPANNNPSSRRLQRAQLAAALLEEPEATDEEDDEDDP